MSDQDLPLRIAVLLLFIGVRFVRWRARKLVGWKASWPAMRRHGLDTCLLLAMAVAWIAAVVIFVACPALVAPLAVPIPVVIRWCAVPVAVAGLALIRWADHYLGENLSVSLRIREHHTLVTGGPYRWVRHPIYTAMLLYVAALAVVTANIVLAVAFLLPTVLIVLLRLGREEQMMIDQFGQEYQTYMKSTGRLLPKWCRS
jgi:protein-S-isoprenylcysteine O-methyltransferase Ste14